MQTLIDWFYSVFVRLFSIIYNYFLAFKAFSITLVTVVIPTIFNNLFYALMETMFGVVDNIMQNLDPGVSADTTVAFTGLASYFVQQFGIGECFSIILSAMLFRFAISFIPFVGPK